VTRTCRIGAAPSVKPQWPCPCSGCQRVCLRQLPGAGAYAKDMSVMREELHHLIDQLPEEQVAPILALVRESLPVGEDGETLWPLPSFVTPVVCGDAGQWQG
jgi:hypothetical protein